MGGCWTEGKGGLGGGRVWWAPAWQQVKGGRCGYGTAPGGHQGRDSSSLCSGVCSLFCPLCDGNRSHGNPGDNLLEGKRETLGRGHSCHPRSPKHLQPPKRRAAELPSRTEDIPSAREPHCGPSRMRSVGKRSFVNSCWQRPSWRGHTTLVSLKAGQARSGTAGTGSSSMAAGSGQGGLSAPSSGHRPPPQPLREPP